MPPAINSTAPAARNEPPPLTDAERETLNAASVVGDAVRFTQTGSGITPGRDYVAPPVKREIAGGAMMFYGEFEDGSEDQPDPYYEPQETDTDSDV
ncbi:hypothetical protein M422DRAFT_273236 [Sphaerobolus stellatus SS14]|uniref:Uncharacterized protein n=1 Tax=Sphaerobolus stellatus (strain SS14) TaxID=990650 RepID=A0A0C9T9P4_SPHS4|nr:hypothetical protein M422DRAFT_273236 [Sphaerobolus stellatus SS14]